MTERKVNPILKQVLELGPTILFFVLYMLIRDETFVIGGREYSGFIVATVALIPVLLISIAVLWRKTGRLSRLQVFTGLMVVIFGGLTAILNDERFFKMKTTIVYAIFATLLGAGLLRGQSWLEWVMGDLLPMRREGWMQLTRRLAAFFAVLAVANEVIWRTQAEAVWVTIETFAFPFVTFLFIWMQIMALRVHLINADDPAGPPADR